MKAITKKPIHRMESLTGWGTAGAFTFTLDTDKKEGEYAFKIVNAAGTFAIYYRYDPVLDIDIKRYMRLWVKSPTSATFWLILRTDAANFSTWINIATTPEYTEISIDLDNPDSTNGDGFDKTKLWSLEFFNPDPGTWYFDYANYETDVESKISECMIYSPTPQKPYTLCTMVIRPDDESYFVEGETIIIKDDSDVICFAGRIVEKDERGTHYKLTALGWDHEFRGAMYKNSYTAKKTSQILEGQIDSSAYTYYDSSIDDTTITYTYKVAKRNNYMIMLARWMERGVFYQVMEESECKAYFDKEITDVNLLPLATLIFPATHDFRDDTVGADPSGWTVDEAGGTINVIASLEGHKKVVELDDTNGEDDVILSQTISRTNGIVEFWIRIDENNKQTFFFIQDGTYNHVIDLLWQNDGNLQYYDGAWHVIDTYNADQWYHIKIKFDCGVSGDGTNDWHLWVDSVSKDGGTGYSFRGTPITMDLIKWVTGTACTTKTYIDAIGYSWDPQYTVGDNLAQLSDAKHCDGVNHVGKKSLDIGLTRVHVWGGWNSKEQVNYPASSSAPEQETGIIPTYPFTDTALTNYTEVKQLADNILAIFGTAKLFIELVVQGVGFMQPWYRVRYANSALSMSADDYGIAEWIYDAKGDIYTKFIITNGIAYESEFRSIQKQMTLRDDVVNADYINPDAPVSDADGTVLRQRTLTELKARTPIVHIVAGAPDVNYDSADGVEIGDLYVDTTNTKVYMCLSNTAGAADWNQID